MSQAIRIDIESELLAMQAGECGGCRIGVTHKHSSSCDRKLPTYYSPMVHCKSCDHVFSGISFQVCPVCTK